MKNICISLLFTFAIISLLIDSKPKVVYDKIVYESFGYNTFNDISSANEDLDVDEGVNLHIKVDTDDFNYSEKISDDATLEEIRAYKRRLLQKGKECYYEANLKTFELLDLNKYDDVYVSKYSPFIDINISSNDYLNSADDILAKISANRNVDTLYVKEQSDDAKGQISDIISSNEAGEYINNGLLTGNGINVGILEPGIIDKDNPNISGSNYLIRDKFLYKETVDEHTTVMASIIGANTGMARSARLLSVELYGEPSSEIEWLLDNDVDVINMSYGQSNKNGIYSSHSAYMDFIANKYKVAMVAAAGNVDLEKDPTNHNADNPAIAYNVLSVGYLTMRNNISVLSCSLVKEGAITPNIVSFGTVNVPNFEGSQTGTSCSAAGVTGLIALFLEECPSMLLHPEALYAHILACAIDPDKQSFIPDKETGYDGGYGSGIMNLKSMIDNKDWGNYIDNSTPENGKIVNHGFHYVLKGSSLKLGYYWLASATGKVSKTKFNRYELRITNKNGDVLFSTLTNNNSFVVRFTPEESGLYWFDLIQRDSNVTDLHNIGLSFRYINAE